ncbi:MAG: hypothetical protein KKC76_05545 [Proteobacteria bacterium]|nr:hypothetical protein [Pseudomonadota bacterium]MBU4294273.1 hypothetical protein [Pseudomonadota bacterium]MCG2747430.1 hypothetical protein [Desulfobulbaceae bacterium]
MVLRVCCLLLLLRLQLLRCSFLFFYLLTGALESFALSHMAFAPDLSRRSLSGGCQEDNQPPYPEILIRSRQPLS